MELHAEGESMVGMRQLMQTDQGGHLCWDQLAFGGGGWGLSRLSEMGRWQNRPRKEVRGCKQRKWNQSELS